MALLENKKIILGSASPRRFELLTDLGIKFDVIKPLCDETLDEKLSIEDAIIDVSKRKAFSIDDGDIVITADTLVVLGDVILGKPKDENHAFEMLRALSGNTHIVYTAVTIKSSVETFSFVNKSEIEFFELSYDEIFEYIATKEPMDKAGSYGIQDKGSLFVKRINGDFYSVMGLPKAEIYRYLKQLERRI